MFLPKNNNFWVLIRLSSFLLPITWNKGSIRVKFHSFQFSPKNCHCPCAFASKLRFSNFLIRISSFLLPITSNKGSHKGSNKGSYFILSNSLPTIVNYCMFLPQNCNFRVLKRLSSFLLPATSNKRANVILSDSLPKSVNSHLLFSSYRVSFYLLIQIRGQ